MPPYLEELWLRYFSDFFMPNTNNKDIYVCGSTYVYITVAFSSLILFLYPVHLPSLPIPLHTSYL